MKLFTLGLLITLTGIASAQQTIYSSIHHDGLQRDYILYVPASYSPGTPAPLVLNFHGYTSNDFEQMFYGDFRPIADTAGFLVVHPMGTVDILGNTHWNVGWGTSNVDDVGFTSDLIDSLSAQYNINQDRIYSTGMSNGGFMSYRLACDLSNRVAAIASVTGDFNVNTAASCNPQHPMPVMEIHGTADPTVAYDGNILFAPIPSVINYWVTFDNCDPNPVITDLPDIDTTDGCTAQHQVYPGGDNGVEVEHYKIIDGVHAWPGTAFGGAGTNQDFDASKEIWRFFSQYDIHGRIHSTAIDEPEIHSILIYPNPSDAFITLLYSGHGNEPFILYDQMGRIWQKGYLNKNLAKINVEILPSGMYWLKVYNAVGKFVKL
jgi:polyhydroxybutyrate depolymerase